MPWYPRERIFSLTSKPIMSHPMKKVRTKRADPLGIRRRIEDARVLWQAGRKEGAFSQILIAVAATARKRYPPPPKGAKPVPDDQRPHLGEGARDGNAFKTFILDEMETITGGPKYNVAFPFQGQVTPLEDILYENIRCVLVHEGGLPDNISLSEPVHEGKKKLNVVQLRDPLGFPEGWINNLLIAVVQAPENKPIFDDWLAMQREYEARQSGRR
jgi:hypothetical protein